MSKQVCNTCGLPDELCACKDVSKDEQVIEIYTEERNYGKTVTCIKGLDVENIDPQDIRSELQNNFGCGGTFKDGIVELQGDHKDKAIKELEEQGFTVR